MRRALFISLTVVLIFLLLGLLEFYGVIWHNELFALPYKVKGLDVSHHQGEIDWEQVGGKERYRFVFMKATEGKDFVDHRFQQNWKEAKRQGLHVGAYHFFSMKSSGKEQAQNFIRTVPDEEDSLPAVIDVEIPLYHDPEKVRRELGVLVSELEKHYGKKPLFYATYDTYHRYIRDAFPDHEIWIRDIVKQPDLEGRDWLFWQYSNRGRVDGIGTYVDLNVYRGDWNQFLKQFGHSK